MARQGRRILARVGSHVIEPTTGQLALSMAGEMIDVFLEARLIADREVRAAIKAERKRVRPPSGRRVLADGLGTLNEILLGS